MSKKVKVKLRSEAKGFHSATNNFDISKGQVIEMESSVSSRLLSKFPQRFEIAYEEQPTHTYSESEGVTEYKEVVVAKPSKSEK